MEPLFSVFFLLFQFLFSSVFYLLRVLSLVKVKLCKV
jgi:hypothetical protein